MLVGSPHWFRWLGLETTSSFSLRLKAGVYTARREFRPRGGSYWYLYRKVSGHRYKVYLGRAEDLTLARLIAASTRLEQSVANASELEGNSAVESDGLVKRPAHLRARGGANTWTAEPPLVGRDQELALLSETLSDCLSGSGRLMLLGGDAGIGKTALMEWLGQAAAEHGAGVFVGRCYELTASPPLCLWSDVLGRLAPATHAALLKAPQAPPGTAPAVSKQTDVFDQVLAALEQTAAHSPLVVLLDDVQWADPASLDLLRYVARQLRSMPVLVVAAYRFDELDRMHPLAGLLPTLVREANPVRLEPRALDDEAVQQLVQDRYPLPSADSTRLVDYLQARAEGNPFFIHELLRALAQEQHLFMSVRGWRLGELAAVGLPRLLLQVIDRRLAGLSRPAQAALVAAAVIGHEVPQTLWTAVIDLDEDGLADCIDELITAGVLVETDGGASVRFSHALIRHALYEGSLPQLRLSRRRALHRRVGEVLASTSEPDPDSVAYQFQQAGDPRTVEWLLRAGARAERALAWLTAAQRYSEALALLDAAPAPPAERAALRYRLALLRQYEDAPGSERLLSEAVHLATQAGDPRLAAWSRFHQGAVAGYGGEVAGGLAQMEEAMASLDALGETGTLDDQRPLGGLLMRASDHHPRGMLAGWLALAGRLSDARAMGAAPFVLGATAQPNATGPGHPGVHAPYIYSFTGQPEAARTAFVALRGELQAAGDQFMAAVVQSNELIWVALPYATDALAERRRLVTVIDDILRLASGIYDEVPSLWLRLPLLVLEGEWTTARRVAELAVALRGGAQHVAVPVLAVLARDQGEPDIAWTLLRQVLARGPATLPGTTFFAGTLVLQRLAALLALDAGDLATARVWLEAHDRWLTWSGATLGLAEAQLAWAIYHRAAREPLYAEQRAQRGLVLAGDPRQPLALLAAHRLLGELATQADRLDDAAANLQVALDLANACAAPYERALTLLAQAEVALARGRRAAALGLLDEVRETGSLLGATPLVARVAALSAAGPRSVGPVATASVGAALTRREREVACLVAKGLTNRRVAGELVIAEGTAERHVANILGKLALSSRAQLAAWAVESGLVQGVT